jgi:excisionase family DNA binding protein
MQVAYSGNDGRQIRYTCARGFHLHGTDTTCQGLGGGRLDKAVAAAFLEAVTPAGIAASTSAITELTDQHDARLAGQRLALEHAEIDAQRAERQFDACEPENRLVARTLERKLEDTLAAVAREQRALEMLEHARPAPLTAPEREALNRLARDLPRLWAASTTSDRDRKELLRALITEVVVTVRRPENVAHAEIFWEGGARSELTVKLARPGQTTCTPEDTIELICRLAAHHPDHQIAAILNRQGRRTGTGRPFTATRVKSVRQRNQIPAAPPPDPGADTITIEQAAAQLNASPATIRRWLREGLLPGEQVTPAAPWRIRLTDEIRAQFVPTIPDGYVPLAEAAKRLGVARQTVLHQVQRGERHAIQVTAVRRKGLRIQVLQSEAGLFAQ